MPTTPAPSVARIRRVLRREASPERAALVARYFNTGPGEYGEGDRFLGLTLPQLRRVARESDGLPLAGIVRLLESPWHEERTVAVLVLVRRFARADRTIRRQIFELYLRHRRFVNNWDLVDLSAGPILGPYLTSPSGARVRRLARSRNVWDRRMAVLATSYEIREGRYDATLDVAAGLLSDDHDLIHKAVGWMLREVGKRDRPRACRFLDRHGARMPRTMLRYAVERFPPALRRRYMRRGKPRGR